MTNKLCSGCGEQVLREDAAICYNCGYWLKEDILPQNNNETRQTQYVVVDSKSPFLAIILSVILPGAGQLYNKQFLKGFLFHIGFLFSYLLSMILFFLFYIPALIALVAIAWEAYSVSNKMNKGEIPLKNPTAGEIVLFTALCLLILAGLIGLYVSFLIFIMMPF